MTDNYDRDLQREYAHAARRADDGDPLAGILLGSVLGLVVWMAIYLVWWR